MRLWGKRFEKKLSPLAEVFASGRDVRGIPPADERLVPYDLWGSRAHAVMLARQGIVPRKVTRTLIKGLKEIDALWKEGKFRLAPSREDVHTNVESCLIDKYGMEVGGRLHTARSRNDQIAVDMRLYLRDCALTFVSSIQLLIETLTRRARKEGRTTVPGYTHHQPAQVTTLGHIWLSYAEAFLRDIRRFQDWYERFNRNPLGSMTGYGTSFPIDRNLTSRLLGFDAPSHSSLDPIQNRWEPEAELGFALAALMNHLSSLAQTLILFCTGEFGLLKLDDAYSTGSSMMPQKRNPDPLEVIKGKAAVAQGMLLSLLSLGRSLFLGYNRDTQWTKYLIMDLIDECTSALPIMAQIVSTLTVKEKEMAARCRKGFITAPDLVEKIVQDLEVPFRFAKGVVEKAIKYSEQEGAEQVTPGALRRALQEENIRQGVNEKFVASAQDPKSIVSRRNTVGGTSLEAQQMNIISLNRSLKISNQWLRAKKRSITRAQESLASLEKNL